ncbi:MAG: MFS transporter [Brevinematales bacterium]|nr:MFS transporter [Brevinematales bacterium]
MKKILTVISSFVIMLCLGGVYAWSIVASELKKYNFSASQSQLIFGLLIAIFTISMIFAGKIERKKGSKIIGFLSALFFTIGYLVAGFSNGNFFLILVGISVLAGIGTGFGYLASLTTPVKWFPDKKGLITGIAAAGFGLAATILSLIIEFLLESGKDIFNIFIIIGISYGLIITIFSFFLDSPIKKEDQKNEKVSFDFLKSTNFYKLFAGILFGTFAGLLIIGSLKPIGISKNILDAKILAFAISFFAISNFLGRIIWGFISDYIGSQLTIIFALIFQAISIFLLGNIALTDGIYILISALIGFGFGGNFVLFARETGHIYGIDRMGIIYPYVFLGYGIAGILGPLTAGFLFDLSKTYTLAIYIAAFISLCGGVLFTVSAPKIKS